MIDRYVVNAQPGDQARERIAFELAENLTQEGAFPLVYAGLSVRQFAASFDWYFGPKEGRAIAARKHVGLSRLAREVVTLDTIRPSQVQGVILGIRCIPEMLQKIDQCHFAKSVVLLAFNEREGLDWAQKHGAKMVR
jgi:hypothetical protein